MQEVIENICKNENITDKNQLTDDIFNKIYENLQLYEENMDDATLIKKFIKIYETLDNFLFNCKLLGKNVQTTLLSNGEIDLRLQWIDEQPNYIQKTKEWYDFRNSMITASDLSNVISSKQSLVKSKLSNKRGGFGDACLHGNKYEVVAKKLYEKWNGVTVKEYGCIRHPTIPYFGASPDGVCYDGKYRGRLLEIKCPKSRIINGDVSVKYAWQMQGQMEVLNLEECDFLECCFKEFNDCENFENLQNEKGCIVSCLDAQGNTTHLYSPIDLNSLEDINIWYDKLWCDEKICVEGCISIDIKWWHLENYSCQLVKRNKQLFESIKNDLFDCWNMVKTEKEKNMVIS